MTPEFQTITKSNEDLLVLFYEQLYVNIYTRLTMSLPDEPISINDGTVQEFFKKNQNFYFRDKSFVFCESKKSTSRVYINPQFKDDNNRAMKIASRIELYKKLFPSLEFIKSEKGITRTPWYDSKLFLALMPTRANIIKNLLTEL